MYLPLSPTTTTTDLFPRIFPVNKAMLKVTIVVPTLFAATHLGQTLQLPRNQFIDLRCIMV